MINVKEYSDALFLLTEELGSTESVLDDVTSLREIMKNEPDYAKLLDSPALSLKERLGLAKDALSSLDENLLNLVMILTEKKAVFYLPKILDGYIKSYEESRGIERVSLTSARPLTDEQLERLRQILEGKTGKKIIITATVDPSLLGGIKLQYMGIQIDGSVKSKLDELEKRLCDTIV